MKFLTTLTILVAVATNLFAADPPAALVAEVPAAQTDPKAACVRVVGPDAGTGVRDCGSGTCIACENEKSIVVTCNHIFSSTHDPRGGFVDTIYPLKATVVSRNREYTAVVVSGDRAADLAFVVVDGVLPVAPVAASVPAAGEKVWRYGVGSGAQTAKVIDGAATEDRFGFVTDGVSESGDSGAAYFNADGELVAVHCGKNEVGRPRGTPVTVVRSVTRTRAVLFPRLRAKLGLGVVTAPPVAKIEKPKAPEPKPKAPDPKPKKVEPPKAAPVVQYRVEYYRVGLRTYSRLVPVGDGGCPGGVCPIRP